MVAAVGFFQVDTQHCYCKIRQLCIGIQRYTAFVSAMIIAVLASGEGTTLQAVLDACAQQRLPARVGIVISNNPTAGALRRARAAGVPARHLSAATAGGAA